MGLGKFIAVLTIGMTAATAQARIQTIACDGRVLDSDGYSIGKKTFEIIINGKNVSVTGLSRIADDKVKSAERSEGRLHIQGANSTSPFSIALPLNGLKLKRRFAGTTLILHTGGGDFTGRFVCKSKKG